MVSSTLSSLMAPFSPSPFPSAREKLSLGKASSFVIFCLTWRKQKYERRNRSETRVGVSHASCDLDDYPRGGFAHRSASLELHARRRHGSLLRSRSQKPPPGLCRSAPRTFCRRPFRRFLQDSDHVCRLRQLPPQRRHWPLPSQPPHHRSDQPCDTARRFPVFRDHRLCVLDFRLSLSPHG